MDSDALPSNAASSGPKPAVVASWAGTAIDSIDRYAALRDLGSAEAEDLRGLLNVTLTGLAITADLPSNRRFIDSMPLHQALSVMLVANLQAAIPTLSKIRSMAIAEDESRETTDGSGAIPAVDALAPPAAVPESTTAAGVAGLAEAGEPVTNGTAPSATSQKLGEPSADAFAAYRVSVATGKNQAEVAGLLTEEFGRPVSSGVFPKADIALNGKVRYWRRETVEAWIEAQVEGRSTIGSTPAAR